MTDLNESVRWLEQEVTRLANDNKALELDNAQYRQRTFDAEAERDKAQNEAKFLNRENGELVAILEGNVQSVASGLQRYRRSVQERSAATNFNLRPSFTRGIADDVAKNGVEGRAVVLNTAAAPEGESDGTRALREAYSELPNPDAPTSPRPAEALDSLHRLAADIAPRSQAPAALPHPAVRPYVRPGTSERTG